MRKLKPPVPGTHFRLQDFDDILDVIRQRILKHNEPVDVAIGVALFNAGDRWKKVICTKGEWRAYKFQISPTNSLPHCPNGHPLLEEAEEELVLGWVSRRVTLATDAYEEIIMSDYEIDHSDETDGGAA